MICSPQPTDFSSPGSNIVFIYLFIINLLYRASVNCKCLPWNKQGCCQSFLLILCRLSSLSSQYGWLLFCSILLTDWPLFYVGNNSLTVAFTLFSQINLLILPKIYFPFCRSLQFCTPNFSLAVVIAEKLVQMNYISELVSDPTPIGLCFSSMKESL